MMEKYHQNDIRLLNERKKDWSDFIDGLKEIESSLKNLTNEP